MRFRLRHISHLTGLAPGPLPATFKLWWKALKDQSISKTDPRWVKGIETIFYFYFFFHFEYRFLRFVLFHFLTEKFLFCLCRVWFLDAFSHLHKRLCPSIGPFVRPSVRPSVGWLVGRSVGHTRVEFLKNGPTSNKIASGIRKYAI